jgi:hypothetical protein
VRYGLARRGIKFGRTINYQFIVTRPGKAWHGMARQGKAWHGMVRWKEFLSSTSSKGKFYIVRLLYNVNRGIHGRI